MEGLQGPFLHQSPGRILRQLSAARVRIGVLVPMTDILQWAFPVSPVLQMTFILGKFYGPLPNSSFHVSGVFLFRVEHVYPFQNEMLGATPSLHETQSEARDLHCGDLSLGIRGSLGQGRVRASGAHVTPWGSFPEGPWSGGRGSRAPSAHESSVAAWPGTSSRLCKTC